MRCDQARQFFDAYLDGELSPSLATELGAHRLRCADCRQALALMEVSGHIVKTDQEPVQLRRNFTERLLDCVNQQSMPWLRRWRRQIYIGGPMAAAAVIALAFFGVFDNPESRVLSEKGVLIERTPVGGEASTGSPYAAVTPALGRVADEGNQEVLKAWIDQTRQNIAAKRESGESLRQFLDQKLEQWDSVLDDTQADPEPEDQRLEANQGVPPMGSDEADSDGESDEDG